MKNLIKKFQNISHRYNLWQKGSKIVLGVSGGPDSVCMLDIFMKLKDKYDLDLIVAHVNYGLRGKDSDRDEKFVRNLAEKYSIEAKLLKKQKLSFYGKKVPSENELRNIRYDFFEKVRAKNEFNSIAVGHTLDDQAETLLMRLIRGSGLAGLASMRHKNIHPVKSAKSGPAERKFSRGAIIRPLLGITKEEIFQYLEKNKLKYRIDKTNKEIPFLRNRIRNWLIPQLEKKFNPNIKKTLYGASLSVADDYDLISKSAEEYYFKNKKLSVKKLLKLHPALQKRILLKAIQNKKSDLKDIETSHIEEILKVLKSAKKKNQKVIFKSLKLVRKDDKITLSLIG